MTRAIIATLALFAAAPALAVYKCETPDGVVFSQLPCAPNAEQITVNAPTPSAAETAAAQERVQAYADEQSLERLRRQHDRQIYEAKQRLNTLELQREVELEVIRARKARAANNLAGATWEQALATEMQSVVMRYDPQIQQARDEIAKLEAARP